MFSAMLCKNQCFYLYIFLASMLIVDVLLWHDIQAYMVNNSQRGFDVLISREGKKEQRRSEPWRDWGEEMVKRTPASRRRSHGRNFCT